MLALKKLSLGMILGLLPTLSFNYLIFGKPWLPPNLAGKVADTMPLWSLPNFLDKLWFYLASPTTSLFIFSPILIFGIIGILKAPKILLLIPLFQLAHISLMETFGGYQYGPRYLLTTLPYLSLGIVYWLRKRHNRFLGLIFGLAFTYSVGVAFLGAIRTVMYEVPGPYAPHVFLEQWLYSEGPDFRLFLPGLVLVIFSVFWFYKLKRAE